MSAKRSIGDPEILKKRIPQNQKYEHIKTRLDTDDHKIVQSKTEAMEKSVKIGQMRTERFRVRVMIECFFELRVGCAVYVEFRGALRSKQAPNYMI